MQEVENPRRIKRRNKLGLLLAENGRTVADVQCRGKDASTELVRTGMAWVFDKYAKGYEALYPLQDAAKAAQLGLWADPAPQPPWEWRHK